MLLAVDIGNTNIKIALFKGKKIFSSWRLLTDKGGLTHQYEEILKKLFGPAKIRTVAIEAILVCSVVPKLTPVFKKALFSLFKKRPLILGKDIIAPIKNLYKKPEQVGQDRLANAVGAVNKYGSPIIVVDFGTALTFDVITAAGSYLGGIIVPGLELSLKALTGCADLLPEVVLSRPRALLGRETVASIRSGIVYGYSFLVEGILRGLKKELRLKVHQVVATGGKAPLVFLYCRSINKIDKNLTLEGLRVIYEKEIIGKNRQKRIKIG